jgi:cytidine deaminase
MDSPSRNSLVAAAREAAERAHAPYSEYRVGAAVLTQAGEVVAGCNVENASYGLSICAERVAVFVARARGLADRRTAPLAAVAIHAPKGPMPWPCGACRQVLSEFAPAGTVILVNGAEGTLESTLGELLPRAFTLER